MHSHLQGERRPGADSEERPLAERARVLIVDDDRDVRIAFARAVRRGFDVDEAAHASAAIERTSDNVYDVIVTDLIMPEVDGISLIQTLVKTGVQTSYVLLTGTPTLELPAHEPALREISEILRKPWQQDELYRVLTRAVTRSRARRRTAPDADVSQLKVLVVEDDELDSYLVRRRLEASGRFAVTHAERLSTALEALAREHFDLVISDLSLPDACGLDAVTLLRRTHPDVPVVVLTGMDDQTMALQVAQAGAQNYLVKESLTHRGLDFTLWCAIETHRREMTLASKALHDPLTGLCNREGLEDAFRRMKARAQRSAHLMACLVLDLDYFKSINDTLGHAAGDLVLQDVARRLLGAVREADFVSRLGGDEFCVVAEVADPHQALLLRDRIIGELELPVSFNGRQLTATASIGVSVLAPEAAGLADLLRAADRDMYAAKGNRHSMSLTSR